MGVKGVSKQPLHREAFRRGKDGTHFVPRHNSEILWESGTVLQKSFFFHQLFSRSSSKTLNQYSECERRLPTQVQWRLSLCSIISICLRFFGFVSGHYQKIIFRRAKIVLSVPDSKYTLRIYSPWAKVFVKLSEICYPASPKWNSQ